MALPNWAEGVATWAKGHRAQAAAIGACVLVVLVFMFSGGGGDLEGPFEEGEEDMFGAGALPEDVTTVKAMSEMQSRMESLSLSLARQVELHERLVRSVEDQGRELRREIEGKERAWTDQLEAALSQAVQMARESLPQAGEGALALPPPMAPKMRILRPSPVGVTAEAPGPEAEVPAEPPGGPWARLPLGSVVTGELLTGAFATKVRGDALPVLVQLRSAYSGPNDSEIPLEDCLLIGKATADIASVRARVEAVNLSCVLPDGTSFERPVRGYFTGEDGTLGVPGRWEFRSGRWLSNLISAMGTAAAGVYADLAIAESLAGANILGSVSTSDTKERIQEFFLERAEEILPVVWVESGTPVYVVMLEGLTIEGMPAEVHYPVATSVFD